MFTAFSRKALPARDQPSTHDISDSGTSVTTAERTKPIPPSADSEHVLSDVRPHSARRVQPGFGPAPALPALGLEPIRGSALRPLNRCCDDDADRLNGRSA